MSGCSCLALSLYAFFMSPADEPSEIPKKAYKSTSISENFSRVEKRCRNSQKSRAVKYSPKRRTFHKHTRKVETLIIYILRPTENTDRPPVLDFHILTTISETFNLSGRKSSSFFNHYFCTAYSFSTAMTI